MQGYIKQVFFSLILAFFAINSFGQDTLMGRPTFKSSIYNHLSANDNNGYPTVKEQAAIADGEYLADELVVGFRSVPPGYSYQASSINNLLALTSSSSSLRIAIQSGIVADVQPLIKTSAFPFTTQDLIAQRNAGLDKFFIVRLTNHDTNILKNQLNNFRSDPTIESATLSPIFRTQQTEGKNGVTYTDPLFAKQWDFLKISANLAHTITTGSQHVYVFVNDTGFLLHPDLNPENIFFKWDAVKDRPGTDNDDDYGHGTHILTSICAKPNNGKGIAGLAPGVKCGSVKVLSNGSGTIQQVAMGFAINVAKAAEIRTTDPNAQFISNWSLGASGVYASLNAAVRLSINGGVFVIASAGNGSANIDVAPVSPGSCPGAISVAATDSDDNIASFSNFGPKTVPLAAPGVNTWGGVPTANVKYSDPSGYMVLSGTSMSAPRVVSEAALILSLVKLDPSTDSLRNLLTSNIDPVKGFEKFVISGGRINMYLATNIPTIPPNSPEKFGVNVSSHSSAEVYWTSVNDSRGGKLAGASVYYSKKPFGSNGLNSSDIKVANAYISAGAGQVVSFTLNDLDENTKYYGAVKLRDRGENLSPLTNLFSFTTFISQTFAIRNFEVLDKITNVYKKDPGQWHLADGPAGVAISAAYGGNPLLWHLEETYLDFHSAPLSWRYGQDSKLNYNIGQVTDGMIVSEIFDLSQTFGLSLTFSKFQQTSQGETSPDLVELYVKTFDENNRGSTWSVVNSFGIGDNTPPPLRFETFRQSLTKFAGKKVQFAIRFLAVSSGDALGFLMDDFTVKIDNPQQNIPPSISGAQSSTYSSDIYPGDYLAIYSAAHDFGPSSSTERSVIITLDDGTSYKPEIIYWGLDQINVLLGPASGSATVVAKNSKGSSNEFRITIKDRP